MSNEIQRNCNSCKSELFANCDALQNNKEYQAIQNLPQGSLGKEYQFKDNFICNEYKCRHIEYPLEVSNINIDTELRSLREKSIGKFAKIVPCAKECGGKTYLGLFLGDLPLGISVSHNSDTKELNLGYYANPAIFVFDLNKIIFGAESWWSIIETEEDLKAITPEDIQNVWYVKALKALSN